MVREWPTSGNPFPGAAVTKPHRPGGLDNRNVSPHILGAGGDGRALLPLRPAEENPSSPPSGGVLAALHSSAGSTPPQCLPRDLGAWSPRISVLSLLVRTRVMLDKGPPLSSMMSSLLFTSVMTLFPNKVTFRSGGRGEGFNISSLGDTWGCFLIVFLAPPLAL